MPCVVDSADGDGECRMCGIWYYISLQTHHRRIGSASRCVVTYLKSIDINNTLQNANMIQKVVALLVPGLTPDLLSLPPLPTSATVNPNLPLSIPLLSPADVGTGTSAASIPFIASTFSHACPTRAPGDQTRMHSVLSAFFTGPVSGEEKKRRLTQRVQCKSLSPPGPW